MTQGNWIKRLGQVPGVDGLLGLYRSLFGQLTTSGLQSIPAMNIRRLRIFSLLQPTSTKQALTR